MQAGELRARGFYIYTGSASIFLLAFRFSRLLHAAIDVVLELRLLLHVPAADKELCRHVHMPARSPARRNNGRFAVLADYVGIVGL